MDSNVDWTWISVFWVLVAIIAVILIRQMKDNYYNMNYIFETKSDENGNHFWANNVPNYASFSAGAVILSTSKTEVHYSKVLKIRSMILAYWSPENSDPNKVLQPWEAPGDCWSFSGSQATFRVKLSHTIIPRGFTLEHIPVQISPTKNIDSAPHHFSVYAYETEDIKVNLGHFLYDDQGPQTQSFQLNPMEHTQVYPTRVMEVQIHSNHGNPQYTCVYRILIHGDLN